MKYSGLANIAAGLAVVFGVFGMGMGIFVATFDERETRVALQARYLNNKTSGQAIDQGLYVILFGIALGTLAEIARNRPGQP